MLTAMELTNAQLLEKVVYTASLASDFKAIDNLMDTVRGVTAVAGSAENFSSEQRQTLLSVQQELERHLVQDERLRFFTAESLQVQIEQHLAGSRSARRGLIPVFVTLGVAAVSVVLIASFSRSGQNIQQSLMFGGAVTAFILNVGAAWLFLSALPAFKSTLRSAFKILCAGLVLLSVGFLEQPFIVAANLPPNSSLGMLLTLPVMLIAIFCMYLGIARYARLAGVISRSVSGRVLGIAAVAILATALFVPHHTHTDNLIVTVFAVAGHGWIGLLVIMATMLLIKTIKLSADLYKPPLRALTQAILISILAALFQFGAMSRTGAQLSGNSGLITFGLALVMGAMLVRAGYSFNKISRY